MTRNMRIWSVGCSDQFLLWRSFYIVPPKERRMLVVHCHQFDTSLSSTRWPWIVGSHTYALALRIDQWHRRHCYTLEQRSLSWYLRSPLLRMVRYLTGTRLHERAVLERARQHKADGIICGHTHRVGQHLIDHLMVLQRWRLGTELHGVGGIPRWHSQSAALEARTE